MLYVWFDMLINYLNGVGYGESEDRIIHVIVKDVLKFHALYWPAMLSSAGLRHPYGLHVHGFLSVDGRRSANPGERIRSNSDHLAVRPRRFALLTASTRITDRGQ